MRSRWLHHVSSTGRIEKGPEGFLHCSFLPDVEETVRLYFGGSRDVRVFCIDPRRVPRIEIAETPRGPMPHVFGEIAEDAIAKVTTLDAARDDAIRGTRFGFVAFSGMTLLDLVGVHDPISRIAKMKFDGTARCEIVAAHDGPLWSEDGARFDCARVRPALADYDVLVVPGGLGTRALERDRATIDWLATFPRNRLAASVCTGALLLGAAGRLRGKRATTHANAMDQLERHGAIPTVERVVDEGDVITAGGVTSGLHLGLHLAREIAGDEAARAIARQMEWP